jgi:hypothetical protein
LGKYINKELIILSVNNQGLIKPSRKSRMKKSSPHWEELKIEVAKEIDLWRKIEENGWASLTSAESGRLGGILRERKSRLKKQ